MTRELEMAAKVLTEYSNQPFIGQCIVKIMMRHFVCGSVFEKQLKMFDRYMSKALRTTLNRL